MQSTVRDDRDNRQHHMTTTVDNREIDACVIPEIVIPMVRDRLVSKITGIIMAKIGPILGEALRDVGKVKDEP